MFEHQSEEDHTEEEGAYHRCLKKSNLQMWVDTSAVSFTKFVWLQRLMTLSKDNLFCTGGNIKDKTIDIIIDNGSIDNLIFVKSVAALKLTTEKHPKPYHLGWIKSGEAVEVHQQCLVPLSIGKHYVDRVLGDVVPMDGTIFS